MVAPHPNFHCVWPTNSLRDIRLESTSLSTACKHFRLRPSTFGDLEISFSTELGTYCSMIKAKVHWFSTPLLIAYSLDWVSLCSKMNCCSVFVWNLICFFTVICSSLSYFCLKEKLLNSLHNCYFPKKYCTNECSSNIAMLELKITDLATVKRLIDFEFQQMRI